MLGAAALAWGIGESIRRAAGRSPSRSLPRGKKPRTGRFFLRLRSYTLAAVAAHWRLRATVDLSLACERRFLVLDLAYPPCYGGLLAGALLLASDTLGITGCWWLALVPVALTMLSDWTENGIQLR